MTNIFKATGANNNFHSNKSKKSFSKRQEQKIIFEAISAKKNSKRKATKNIFKATPTQETFSKRKTQQIHFKATSAKKVATSSENLFQKSKQKTVLKQQFCSKFSWISFQIQRRKIIFRKEKT